MARLIDAEKLKEFYEPYKGLDVPCEEVCRRIDSQPTVDAAPVVHGEWIKHGYKWRCSECGEKINIDGTPLENGLYYCPNCGADMRVGRWKGEGMGDYSCSLCGEVVSGNHREKCPNCHAKMDGGEKE